jgi:hypothetical protein
VVLGGTFMLPRWAYRRRRKVVYKARHVELQGSALGDSSITWRLRATLRVSFARTRCQTQHGAVGCLGTAVLRFGTFSCWVPLPLAKALSYARMEWHTPGFRTANGPQTAEKPHGKASLNRSPRSESACKSCCSPDDCRGADDKTGRLVVRRPVSRTSRSPGKWPVHGPWEMRMGAQP